MASIEVDEIYWGLGADGWLGYMFVLGVLDNMTVVVRYYYV